MHCSDRSLFPFFFFAFGFEHTYDGNTPPARLPVLDFPLKRLPGVVYTESHPKVHKLPNTIRQEVVKSLLNYNCLA